MELVLFHIGKSKSLYRDLLLYDCQSGRIGGPQVARFPSGIKEVHFYMKLREEDKDKVEDAPIYLPLSYI